VSRQIWRLTPVAAVATAGRGGSSIGIGVGIGVGGGDGGGGRDGAGGGGGQRRSIVVNTTIFLSISKDMFIDADGLLLAQY